MRMKSFTPNYSLKTAHYWKTLSDYSDFFSEEFGDNGICSILTVITLLLSLILLFLHSVLNGHGKERDES